MDSLIGKGKKPRGTPLPTCPQCGSSDIGWCRIYGGWWCVCGTNCNGAKV